MEDDDRYLTFIEFITFNGSKEVEREYTITYFDKKMAKLRKLGLMEQI